MVRVRSHMVGENLIVVLSRTHGRAGMLPRPVVCPWTPAHGGDADAAARAVRAAEVTLAPAPEAPTR